MSRPSPALEPPAPPPYRGRIRMVYLLLGVFAIVALAPLSSVAWKLIERNREALKTSQQEYQLLLASTISREIDIHVEALRGQLDRGSRALARALVRAERGDDETIRRVLDGVVDERLLYMRFTDLRGRAVASRGFEASLDGMDRAFSAGFREATESLADRRDADALPATHGDPFLLPGTPPRAMLLLSAPVVAGGNFLGVVSAIIDIQSVWDEVVGDHRTPHALFAVDAKGRLFASANLLGVSVGRDMADSEMVTRFRSHTGQARETMPFDWSPRRSGRRERYLGSYEVSREGWGVFVQANERQFYSPVTAMIESTVRLALVALVCALFAAGVFARLLAAPIKRLAKASRAFEREEFSARAAVSPIAEVGELADTFNHMAAKLEKKIRDLEELFKGTAKALAGAIDAKDPYTRGHSERVNRYAVILAQYHGLPAKDIRDIDVSSLLHDVGKIGVRDEVLRKPGQLTSEEFEEMKQHTVIGEKIMKPILQMEPLLPGLRSHHERWKGGGYPDNKAGEAIPLMARIIAVADSFDAMTTDRPYQKAMTFDQAHARVNELKGSAFDDHVVASFNRAYQAGEFTRPARGGPPRPEAPAEHRHETEPAAV